MTQFPSGFAVRRGDADLRAFASPNGAKPLGAVQPRNTADIQALIKWANGSGGKLLPISSAEGPRRHGCTASETPAIVVDLSAMKRVHHVDGVDAIAVIEPGVTFPEFDAQLAEYGLRSYKPLLPRRSKSVIASHLEREPITSPRDQWDAADPLATVELVFGSGEKFRTGSASSADELPVQLQHGLRQMSSLGPFHTDFTRVIMGSQGALAVVSWASIYCERIPAIETAYFVSSAELAPLAKLASRIGWRKNGAQCFIVNNAQLALIFGADRASVLKLAERFPPWTLFVNITALDFFPEDRIAYETEALEEDAVALGLALRKDIEGFQADRITQLQSNLPQVHYKERLGAAVDEIFFLSQTDKAEPLVRTFSERHAASGAGLPFAAYIQPRVQSSSAHVEFTSFWDQGTASAQTAFHQQASQALSSAGAFFSRPYGVWKTIAYERDAQIVPHLRWVKSVFDPNAVMNPGKIF